VPVADFTPTHEEVGAIAMMRTRDDVGNETGTFDDTTRPNYDQVQMLIQKAVEDVAGKTGADIPEPVWERARDLVALRTAMLIELTYFASEVAQNRSPYNNYKQLYDEQLMQVVNEVRAQEAGESSGDEPSIHMARYEFPPPDNMESRQW
jgi:hypothetical protein